MSFPSQVTHGVGVAGVTGPPTMATGVAAAVGVHATEAEERRCGAGGASSAGARATGAAGCLEG